MISAGQIISDYLDAAAKAGASRSTLRQRRWALALLLEQSLELTGEGAAGPAPDTAATPDRPAKSLDSRSLTAPAFIAMLAQAELRLVASQPEAPIPTVRAWRAAIRALAGYAGVPADLTSLPAPTPRRVLSSEGVRALETLRRRQMITLMPQEQARLSMVLALLTAAPLTGTQLCGLHLHDLDERMATLAVPVRPRQWRRLELRPDPGKSGPETAGSETAGPEATRPKAATTEGSGPEAAEPEMMRLDLPAYVRDAITRWLAVRNPLVQALRGSTDVLLVSVAANHDPRTSAVLPPGLPLKPRGLQRSFTRAALAANAELVGQPGFPLPTSLELARRSYHAWRTCC